MKSNVRASASIIFGISRWLGVAALASALSACGGGSDNPVVGPAPSPGLSEPAAPGAPVATPVVPVVVPAVALPTCTAAVPANAPLQTIAAVQGTGSVSPFVSATVTVRGVVVGEFQNSTVNRLGGFFIQQTESAANPLASRGIFVFAPNAAKVTAGDYLQLTGVVNEFGSAADSVTQIAGSVTFTVCGGGVPVTPTPVTLPVAAAQTLERFEGMLVELNQPLAVTELFELGRFGSLALSAGGRQFHPNNGNVVVTNAQNRLGRIVLDDGSSVQNPNPTPYFSAPGPAGIRRMGDTTQKVTGVLSHGFSAYRIHPTAPPLFVNANPRKTTPPDVGGTLKVASLNVLNYFTTFTNGQNAAGQTGQGCTLGREAVTARNCRGADNLIEFERQQAKIVEAILGLNADVLGLMEIQNTDIATQQLVSALNARAGAGTYAAVNSGTIGTDAIKVDILYKPATVDRVGGTVLPTGADLANYIAIAGRPPLAQRFASRNNGGNFWFVVNHFKSKGGCPATGDVDTGQGCFNLGRTQQANALKNFVATLKTQGEPDVLMMGDFNSYLLEDPTRVLESDGSESLLKRMPAADRFTYVFGGESGALDHAYASSTLRQQVSGVGVWHINADEPTAIDYNLNLNLNITTDDRFAPTPFRASDHDPVLVGLNLSPDAAHIAIHRPPLLAIALPLTATANQPVTLTINDASTGGTVTMASLEISWGDGTPNSSLPSAGTVAHVYTTAGSFVVGVRLTNSTGAVVTQSGTVTVASAVVVAPVIPPDAPDVIFSEYAEGNSNNKALELYNPTTAVIDLPAYTAKLFSNGASTPTFVLSLSGTLAAGRTLLLVQSNATASFQVSGSVVADKVINFNGNDALTLEKSGVAIDRIGQVGVDPGTEWAANSVATANRTFRRKAAIAAGDRAFATAFDLSVQWDGFAVDAADNLGQR